MFHVKHCPSFLPHVPRETLSVFFGFALAPQCSRITSFDYQRTLLIYLYNKHTDNVVT